MPIPPQSVQKTRARRVFGEFVSDEEQESSSSSRNSSLCYTETDSSTVYSSSATDKRASNVTVVKTVPPNMINLVSRQSTESTVSSNKENALEHRQILVPAAAPPVKSAPLHRARPARRNLVHEMQTKINNATVSVNESLNAARIARKINFEHRSRQISQVRNQWKEEKQEANTYHEESEKMRHDVLYLQRQLASNCTQARVKIDTNEKQKRLDAITQETEFKSQVFREHQKTLREERERKRRESTAARAKLRENHREGHEKLHMIRVEEDHALYEERYEAVKASSQFRDESAKTRRQSFQFRNGDARRIRELYNRMMDEESQREQESIRLKLAAARDAEAYQKKLEEERRQSFAGRNMQGKKQRDTLRELSELEFEKEHKSFELKWAGEIDANTYKDQMERERRESLAKRNQRAKEQRDLLEKLRQEAVASEQSSIEMKLQGERDADSYRRKMEEEIRNDFAARNVLAKQQRELQAQTESEQLQAEHASYELKWAGAKDAEAYKRKLEQERRKSLANRNEERAKHAKVMEELRDLARDKETESLMLKWAGENDAKVYLAKCEEEVRKSLQLRNSEARRHREIEEQQCIDALAAAQEDERLRAQGRQDMENYKKSCAERDRTSLEFRRKEAMVQRLEEKRRHLEEAEVLQANRELEDAAHLDVVEYIKDCQSRRRMSLAFRAKEKRNHRKWALKQAELALSQRMKDSRLRSQDRREREIAQREERKRIALDAIRHAGCSFNVNGAALLRVDY
jgi:hypothetical protein